MGLIRRRVSGNYFGGSRLVVPGQGVYSIKKYNNFVNKSGISKDNYDDIPKPTNTPTPTVTPTPTGTPTPTPTPTVTHGELSLIDPILTQLDEYIIVGNNEYLMFVDPKPKCKCYNFIYDFSGREDRCVARYIDCDGGDGEIVIEVGNNYVCTKDQSSFVLTSGCNGSISGVIDNGVCDELCGLGRCVEYEIYNSSKVSCALSYIDCYGDRGFYTVSPLNTVLICSTSGFGGICEGLVITEVGDCI